MALNTLREAETRASAVVQAARAERNNRMKAAKVEAAEQLDSYRAEMQARFDAKQEEKTGSSGTDLQELERQTEAEVQKIRTDFEGNKDSVLQFLAEKVTEVDLAVDQRRGARTQAGVA